MRPPPMPPTQVTGPSATPPHRSGKGVLATAWDFIYGVILIGLGPIAVLVITGATLEHIEAAFAFTFSRWIVIIMLASIVLFIAWAVQSTAGRLRPGLRSAQVLLGFMAFFLILLLIGMH